MLIICGRSFPFSSSFPPFSCLPSFLYCIFIFFLVSSPFHVYKTFAWIKTQNGSLCMCSHFCSVKLCMIIAWYTWRCLPEIIADGRWAHLAADWWLKSHHGFSSFQCFDCFCFLAFGDEGLSVHYRALDNLRNIVFLVSKLFVFIDIRSMNTDIMA